ncbi:serine hydrolase domain-containing protein [Virgibacillus halodenitrificans]|uniref:serine hydrolase domain-containing protein n=1 Tax=Virgibacillus halodenitrificans TaxID=1482 RepID=UPI0009EA4568|nr:serine hydrolase [Virgibacillus halodenitrificans]
MLLPSPLFKGFIDRGEIRLDDPVVFFLPTFSRNEKEHINIRHLLTHIAGLEAQREFNQEGLRTDQVLEQIYSEYPEYEPVQNFITLYKLIEKIAIELFADFDNLEVFSPLEMIDAAFIPIHETERFAATEYSEQLQDYKRGIVHDENAASMGGV